MIPMREFPQLATSSMLFCEDLAAHREILSKFLHGSVLDVGAGDWSFVDFLRARGVDAVGCDEQIMAPARPFDTLLFAESIGYITMGEFVAHIRRHEPFRVVIKDFYTDRSRVEPFTFDFTTLKHRILPYLIMRDWEVKIQTFVPNRERWKKILATTTIPYVPHMEIHNVLVVATRKGKQNVSRP